MRVSKRRLVTQWGETISIPILGLLILNEGKKYTTGTTLTVLRGRSTWAHWVGVLMKIVNNILFLSNPAFSPCKVRQCQQALARLPCSNPRLWPSSLFWCARPSASLCLAAFGPEQSKSTGSGLVWRTSDLSAAPSLLCPTSAASRAQCPPIPCTAARSRCQSR